MYRIFSFVLPILMVLACHAPVKVKPVKQAPLTTIDYITVGKMMDSIQPPHVIDLRNGNKRLVFIGCDHNRDSTHPQFKTIEHYFNDLQPELAFNEGGQIPDSVHFNTAGLGIVKDGETGYLKYQCDKAGIHMMNGDISDSLEFTITLPRYAHDQLLLYYLMERLVIPYLWGAYGKVPFEEIYNKAIQKWFVKSGFPLTKDQQSINYFKQLYKQYTGHSFELKITPDIELFDYINGGDCRFCAIGRTSKMVRDSILLCKIDESLNTHNRVFVTFGHGHALAVEPALKQIINKHRE